MTTIYARPHTNGLERGDFIHQSMSLSVKVHGLRECLHETAGYVFHGRSYQHLSPDQATMFRELDLETIEKLMDGLERVEKLAKELARIGYREAL